MTEPKHKLSFSAEEMGAKEEKLSSDAPKTRKGRKIKKSMNQKQYLSFEENKNKPSGKLKESAKDFSKEIPGKTATNFIRQKAETDSDENVSVEAVSKGTEVSENAARTTRTYIRRRNRNVSEEKQNKKFKEESSTVNAEPSKYETYQRSSRYESTSTDTPAKSNSFSKWKQKQEIKKEYQAAKSGKTASTAASNQVESSAKKAVNETKDKVVEFVANNKKGVIVVLGIVLTLIIGIGALSSGSVIVQGTTGGIALTTYPSEDSEMIAAEDYYLDLEEKLENRIDKIKRDKRNEYQYEVENSSYTSYYNGNVYVFNNEHIYHSLSINQNIDDISHNPYTLISFLTAKNDCESFRCNNMKSVMDDLFNKQYKLSYRVEHREVEDESRSTQYVYNYDNVNQIDNSYYIYTTNRETHHYYTLYITLKNNTIEDIVPNMLTDDQYDMFDVYNETHGNRDDLFE